MYSKILNLLGQGRGVSDPFGVAGQMVKRRWYVFFLKRHVQITIDKIARRPD